MPAVALDELKARTEAARVQTREVYWRGLAEAAWRRGRALAESGNLPGAERELDRARRISPTDGTILFDLASVLMRAGAYARAAELFDDLARTHDITDAWYGLSAAALADGSPDRAAKAIATALSRAVPTASTPVLADAVAQATDAPGWCGLDGDGTLRIGLRAGAPALDRPVLDGRAVNLARGRLPPGWEGAWQLRVTAGGADLLGSPLSVAAITRLDAFVSAEDGVLRGWAWHPGDPGRVPRLLLATAAGERTLICRAHAEPLPHMPPLARPRLIPPVPLDGPATLHGPGGRLVPGSPLDPSLLSRMAREAARPDGGRDPSVPLPIPAVRTPVSPRAAPAPRGASVVIPVHGNTAATLACIESVRATVPRSTPVIVVDDASRDPALVQALDRLAQRKRIRLIRFPANAGFPAAANAGLRADPGRDVVLLNSDTLVPPGWLERLRDAAYSAADIGTATPLSDNATILTYRGPAGPVESLDRLAQEANGTATLDIPTGIGFCLYLRRDCLVETGLLRAELFAQGYGEEHDLCFRARALGWRSVAALGVFVHHDGGGSFGAARTALMERNAALLERLHPGHDALIADWIAQDPIGPALRRMDALRWAEARRGGSSRRSRVFVTHGGGGGVDRVIEARCAAATAAGLRPIVLRPAEGACSVAEGLADTFPHLRYQLPTELPTLAALLRGDRPDAVEMHHTLGHHGALLGLPGALRAPYDVVIHDYASFCPRIALVSTNRRYCGEPPVEGCEHCVADLGSLLEEEIGVRDLLARSTGVLAGARRVVAPSKDAANRLRRHFPGIAVAVEPWTEPGQFGVSAPGAASVRRVCVVGAVGTEKGYDVLLGCVRDARARALPMEFVLAGYSSDDERLLEAGPIRITGAFTRDEARTLIAAQGAHLAFLPSVWPETWCFALDDCWDAGLPVAAFDLGAPAERIRATGRGWVLPFNLPSGRVNDVLLSCSLPSPAVT